MVEKFLNTSVFEKYFYTTDPQSVSNVGYNDFHAVRGAYAFHQQGSGALHFVLGGRGTLEIGGKTYAVRAGEMFLTVADTEMRYFPDAEDPWDYAWFCLKDTTKIGAALDFSLKQAVQPIPQFTKVRRVLQRMFLALEAEEIGYFGTLSAFYEILDSCTAHTPITGIRAAKAVVDESFTRPSFRIESLCRDVGLSHAQLLRLFKAHYGVTVQHYLTSRRMELACELLRTTDLSVASVALSCGYADENHFMKVFKKEKGSTALQYRKSFAI